MCLKYASIHFICLKCVDWLEYFGQLQLGDRLNYSENLKQLTDLQRGGLNTGSSLFAPLTNGIALHL